MSKSIDTVVKDIYEVMDKGVVPNPDTLDSFLWDMRDAILKQLSPSNRNRDNYLRMSNIGKGDRQVWYDVNGNDTQEKLTPDTRLKFLFGDIIEALLIYLVKEAGHEVTLEQAEVQIGGIKGHIDCKIDGAMVDIKSASAFSFKKFKEGTLKDADAFGYMAQISAYAHAENSEEAGFLVMDKVLGKLCYMPVPKEDRINPVERINHMKKAVAKDTPPPRCHKAVPKGESGNMKLGVNCSYCPHKTTCWSDANDGDGLRLFMYSNKPTWLTEVQKEPKVQEIIE